MKYEQKTGKFWINDSQSYQGYSGKGEGKNNPAMENVKCVGPLPKGLYAIGDPYDSNHTGKFSLPLTPDKNNEMYGRGSFLIHGDSIANPGTASNGCIILPRMVRMKIDLSNDKILEVV